MLKAEQEILIYRKVEAIVKGFQKRLFVERLEFPTEHQKILRDYLKENIQVVFAEHKDNLGSMEGSLEAAKEYFANQLTLKLAQNISIFGAEFVKFEEDKHPVLPIFKQRKYSMLLKL